METVNIARDFSRTPGARFKDDGPFSGELFREQFLEKHFEDEKKTTTIVIVLDGVAGYATSFLEEAFGGLARMFGKARVMGRLQFVSNEDPMLIDEIKGYIADVEK